MPKKGQLKKSAKPRSKAQRVYNQTPEQRAKNAMRKKARYALEKLGRVSKGDGKEVDHKKPLKKGGSNSLKNLRVTTRTANRRKGSK